MTIDQFIQFYKDILNEKEYAVFSSCANKAYNGSSCACALFCSRFDKEKSEKILLSLLNDNDVSLLSFFYLVSAVESVYVRYKNLELLEKYYAFFLSHLSLLDNQTDSFYLTLCSFCFDKLRFFASVLNDEKNKAIFSKRNNETQNKIYSLPFSLSPLFTLSYPQEIVEDNINSIAFTCVFSCELLTFALLSIRGLISYGYDTKADMIKNEIYKNIKPVSNLSCFACAILCEIALSD